MLDTKQVDISTGLIEFDESVLWSASKTDTTPINYGREMSAALVHGAIVEPSPAVVSFGVADDRMMSPSNVSALAEFEITPVSTARFQAQRCMSATPGIKGK